MSNTKTKTTTKVDLAAEIEASQEAHAAAQAMVAQRSSDLIEAEGRAEELREALSSGDDRVSAASLVAADAEVERQAILKAAAERALKSATRTLKGRPWIAEVVAAALNAADLGYTFEGTVKASGGAALTGEVVQRKVVSTTRAGKSDAVDLTLIVHRDKVHRSILPEEIVAALAEHPQIASGYVSHRSDGTVMADGIEVTHNGQADTQDRYRVKLDRGVWPELPTLPIVGRFRGPHLGPVRRALYVSQYDTHQAKVSVASKARYDGQPASPIITMSEPVEHRGGARTVTATYEVTVGVRQTFAEFTDSILSKTVEQIEGQAGSYVEFLGRCTDVQTRLEPYVSGRLGHSVHVVQTFTSRVA